MSAQREAGAEVGGADRRSVAELKRAGNREDQRELDVDGSALPPEARRNPPKVIRTKARAEVSLFS